MAERNHAPYVDITKTAMKFRHSRLPLMAGLSGLLGFFILVGVSLKSDYDGLEERARVEVGNLGHLMELHTAARIRNIDQILQDVQGHVTPEDMARSQAQRGARGEELERLLRTKREIVPEVHGLHLVNVKGDFLYSSLSPLPPYNMADRSHFTAHVQNPEAGLVIAEPVLGRTTGKWTLAVSRRLNNADGSFAGVVVATFLPESFAPFYQSLDLGPHGNVSIRDIHARMLMRFPARDDRIGQPVESHPAQPYMARGDREILMKIRSGTDQVERLLSIRKVGEYPLYVFAGMAPEDYLSNWRSKLYYYSAGSLLLAAVVLGLLVINRRGERQEESARRALAETEGRYRLLLENLPVGVIHFDSRLCLTFCNERFAAMVGSTVQALQGLDLQRLRDQSVLPAMRQALAGEGGTYDGSYRTTLSHIDVWISFRANPLRDASGAIIGGIGIVEDVGEKRRAEDSLRQSERNFRTMADFTYDWEYWQGADGRIVYMTPSVERITGYGVQAFADDPSLLQQIVHPDDRQEFQEHLNQAVFHHEHMVDFRIVRRDGQVRWIAHGCQAVVGEEGEALGRRVSNRDVTERKTLEAELQALNSRLEVRVQEELASNREKDQLLIQQSRLAAMGEMVHNIAHQWRQPLNALGLVIANIRDDFAFGQLDAAALDESVGRALKLLQRMSTTIDDFRNFFRPDRDPADFDLGAAVEDAAFIMEASLKNNDIALERAIEPDLRAWGFHGQFSQAVLNVLANAKEVLQERHVRPARIRLQVSRCDGQVEVTVEDNAGGIPGNVLGHIFEPYFTTKEQGSGIGLYMTKMILERSMHGKIRAENTAEGARFVLTVHLYTLPPTAPMQ